MYKDRRLGEILTFGDDPGASTARAMLDALGGAEGFRTRWRAGPEGTLVLRTKGGMPRFYLSPEARAAGAPLEASLHHSDFLVPSLSLNFPDNPYLAQKQRPAFNPDGITDIWRHNDEGFRRVSLCAYRNDADGEYILLSEPSEPDDWREIRDASRFPAQAGEIVLVGPSVHALVEGVACPDIELMNLSGLPASAGEGARHCALLSCAPSSLGFRRDIPCMYDHVLGIRLNFLTDGVDRHGLGRRDWIYPCADGTRYMLSIKCPTGAPGSASGQAFTRDFSVTARILRPWGAVMLINYGEARCGEDGVVECPRAADGAELAAKIQFSPSGAKALIAIYPKTTFINDIPWAGMGESALGFSPYGIAELTFTGGSRYGPPEFSVRQLGDMGRNEFTPDAGSSTENTRLRVTRRYSATEEVLQDSADMKIVRHTLTLDFEPIEEKADPPGGVRLPIATSALGFGRQHVDYPVILGYGADETLHAISFTETEEHRATPARGRLSSSPASASWLVITTRSPPSTEISLISETPGHYTITHDKLYAESWTMRGALCHDGEEVLVASEYVTATVGIAPAVQERHYKASRVQGGYDFVETSSFATPQAPLVVKQGGSSLEAYSASRSNNALLPYTTAVTGKYLGDREFLQAYALAIDGQLQAIPREDYDNALYAITYYQGVPIGRARWVAYNPLTHEFSLTPHTTWS